MRNPRKNKIWKRMVEKNLLKFRKAIKEKTKPVSEKDLNYHIEKAGKSTNEFSILIREDVLKNLGVPEKEIYKLHEPGTKDKNLFSPWKKTGFFSFEMIDTKEMKSKLDKEKDRRKKIDIESALGSLKMMWNIDPSKNLKVIRIGQFFPLVEIEKNKELKEKLMRKGIGESMNKKILRLAKSTGADYAIISTSRIRANKMAKRPDSPFKLIKTEASTTGKDKKPTSYYVVDLKKLKLGEEK